MSPPIFSELFRWRDICYTLQSNSNFAVPNVKSAFHGSKIISYVQKLVWMPSKEVSKIGSHETVIAVYVTNNQI